MAGDLLCLATLPEGVSHEHSGQLKVAHLAPVQFNHVNFRYPSRPDVKVLHDVTTTIRGNSCTAIVGQSGSGKSTIASLLLGLYEAPQSGRGSHRSSISLGGVDIRKLHMPTLRSMISVVSQQPRLFPDTIAANISYGLEETSPRTSTLYNIEQAAQAAGIHEFITSLPNGYFTIVGDGGVGLSVGQTQRVIIARALIRQPAILILDEATSALDAESSRLIRQTVKKLIDSRKDLMVIIITHSKEMMEIADSVIVMEQGKVIEQGTYLDLAKRKNGKLRKLIDLEAGGEDEEIEM